MDNPSGANEFIVAALGGFQWLVAFSLLVFCGSQVFVAHTRNRTKAYVHRFNFFVSMFLTVMAIDPQRLYGIYPWQLVFGLWACGKACLCLSLSIVFVLIIRAKARIKKTSLPRKHIAVTSIGTLFVLALHTCEIVTTAIDSAVGNAVFTALQTLLGSIYFLYVTWPLQYLREEQQRTIEVMVSSRKESFRNVVGDEILKKIMHKLDVLINIALLISVSSLASALAITILMGVSNDLSLSLYKGENPSVKGIVFEMNHFISMCFYLGWAVYYTWVPVTAKDLRNLSKPSGANTPQSGSKPRRSSIRSVSKLSPSKKTSQTLTAMGHTISIQRHSKSETKESRESISRKNSLPPSHSLKDQMRAFLGNLEDHSITKFTAHPVSRTNTPMKTHRSNVSTPMKTHRSNVSNPSVGGIEQKGKKRRPSTVSLAENLANASPTNKIISDHMSIRQLKIPSRSPTRNHYHQQLKRQMQTPSASDKLCILDTPPHRTKTIPTGSPESYQNTANRVRPEVRSNRTSISSMTNIARISHTRRTSKSMDTILTPAMNPQKDAVLEFTTV